MPRAVAAVLAAVISPFAFSQQTSVISTIAGGGRNNVPALSPYVAPYAAVMDATGNLYLAAGSQNRVYKVDPSGNLTIVAGNGASDSDGDGVAGYGGDGGPAAAASLRLPSGVAIASDGSLLIADEFNHRIRRVDAGTGIITTVAGTGAAGFGGDGGPAAQARVHFEYVPIGVADAGPGRFVFTDNRNGRVRMVTESATAPAGDVPDGGDLSADPLTIAHAPYGQIALSWSASCLTSAADYAVYHGALGGLAVPTPRFCTTGGATSVAFTPDAGSLYYLVVPRTATREGSYGRRSDGGERPASASACLEQEVGTCPAP